MRVLELLDVELEDDDSQYGGVSYKGETLRHFMHESNIPYNIKLEELNKILFENGIKQLSDEKPIYERVENAVKYCLNHSSIDELIRHFDWYNATDLIDLKNNMTTSYLENYDDEEIEERIEFLYDADYNLKESMKYDD